MHYDDAARRFNFLAGLGFGAVLGVGVAMLVAPQKKVRLRRLGGRSRRSREAVSARAATKLREASRAWSHQDD